MIIRRLFNSVRVPTSSIKTKPYRLIHHTFSQSTPLQQQNQKQLLEKTLQEIDMLKQPSLILQELQEIDKRKKRTLTKSDKLKLGLYLPKMALNPRMSIQSQVQYREKVCQQLYELQKTHLQTKVRILQRLTDAEHFTMDKYINTVYKDIYARFLINKGVGVEWEGRFASYGMLNPQHLSQSPKSLISQFLKANIQNIQKVESIAPYSYLTQSFIPTELIEVENIRKIGHYLRLPLTDFGRHQQNFSKLKQKGAKVELLVFCQFLQKLINPHCLCLTPGQKMIILKKQILENAELNPFLKGKAENQTNQSTLRYDYLVASLQTFNKHKQFFTNKQYEKHLIFQSDHMIGMKAEYELNLQDNSAPVSLPIMGEIQGYERNPGVYIVNGSTSIPDYERVQEFKQNNQTEIKNLRNVLDSQGKIRMKVSEQGVQTHLKQQSLSITDLQFQEKLIQILRKKLSFEQLYDVFEDQVYSNKKTSEVLRFRLFDKFQIPISSQSYSILQNHFSPSQNDQIVLHQSKVKLPEMKKFKKPRERRQYKKQVKQSLKQRTEYMTLLESIRSITNIPISGSVEGDIKMWLEKDQQDNIFHVYQDINQIQSQKKLEEITISADLISALTFLYNTTLSHDINSIIIEPQTFTEQILPLCLHLILMKNKQDPIRRGRRTSRSQNTQFNKILSSLKMVYLHPTMKPEQRELNVHDFITGSMKISNKHDYGYGFQAIRLWVCKHTKYLGDRELKERQVNQEMKNGAFIRKLYAQLLPLVPKTQFSTELDTIQFEQLNFLDRFVLQQIDAFILNMEHFYSRLLIKEAYQYMMDFYKNVIDEIFLSTVRHHIITYPNDKDNLSHGVTIKRILQLLSVISPLLPFTSYHISKMNIMKWPEVKNKEGFYKNLLEYNALIKIRTQLKNKLLINRFSHSEVVFPISDQLSYSQSDLKKFFGVDKISFINPEIKQKSFGFKLRHNETLGGKGKLQVYESKQHCIRCDPNSKQKDHLCNTCTSYFQTNVGKQIQFYDKRNNSLLIEEGSVKEKRQMAK